MSVDEYIDVMAESSQTSQHEVILECLDRYDLRGTRELTEEQAKMFCLERGLLKSIIKNKGKGLIS